MAEIVTIEGSVTPCVELSRGDRKTVVLDDRWRQLIRRGYVLIVARHGDPDALPRPAEVPSPEPEIPEQEADDGGIQGDADVSGDPSSATGGGDGPDPAPGPQSAETEHG